MNAPYDRSYSPPLPTVEIVLRLPEGESVGPLRAVIDTGIDPAPRWAGPHHDGFKPLTRPPSIRATRRRSSRLLPDRRVLLALHGEVSKNLAGLLTPLQNPLDKVLQIPVARPSSDDQTQSSGHARLFGLFH
jgi:hypothetical protein